LQRSAQAEIFQAAVDSRERLNRRVNGDVHAKSFVSAVIDFVQMLHHGSSDTKK
jgi:hypothetical protein